MKLVPQKPFSTLRATNKQSICCMNNIDVDLTRHALKSVKYSIFSMGEHAHTHFGTTMFSPLLLPITHFRLSQHRTLHDCPVPTVYLGALVAVPAPWMESRPDNALARIAR